MKMEEKLEKLRNCRNIKKIEGKLVKIKKMDVKIGEN